MVKRTKVLVHTAPCEDTQANRRNQHVPSLEFVGLTEMLNVFVVSEMTKARPASPTPNGRTTRARARELKAEGSYDRSRIRGWDMPTVLNEPSIDRSLMCRRAPKGPHTGDMGAQVTWLVRRHFIPWTVENGNMFPRTHVRVACNATCAAV